MKLSKTQKLVIERMRKGKTIKRGRSFLHPKFWWTGNYDIIRSSTIFKLEKLALVTRTDRYIELTELGRTVEL